jgi:hypothetical protein
MRIISPFPSNPVGILTIFIKQGESVKELINGENFVKVSYEDPHALGMHKGYVHIPVPEAEFESGIYAVHSAVTQTTTGGNVLLRLKKVEWPRNNHT